MAVSHRQRTQKLTPAAAFRAWREYRGLTQKQVEDRIEKSYGTISKLENGAINYTQEHLEALTNAYGLDGVADLLLGPPHPERPESEFERFRAALTDEEMTQALAVLRAMFPRKAA
jgi:transcriptional regulator with XRE-family HTH domain